MDHRMSPTSIEWKPQGAPQFVLMSMFEKYQLSVPILDLNKMQLWQFVPAEGRLSARNHGALVKIKPTT